MKRIQMESNIIPVELPLFPAEIWRESIFPLLQNWKFSGPISVSKTWYLLYAKTKKKMIAYDSQFGILKKSYLSQFKELEILHLDEWGKTLMNIIPSIPNLSHIHTFNLTRGISEINVIKMTQLMNLTALSIDNFYGFPLTDLSLLTNLNVLTLKRISNQKNEMNLILDKMTQLTYLDISGCHFDARKLEKITQLQYLDISRTTINSLSFLEYCTNLKFLSMNFITLTTGRIKTDFTIHSHLNLLSLCTLGSYVDANILKTMTTLKSLELNQFSLYNVVPKLGNIQYLTAWHDNNMPKMGENYEKIEITLLSTIYRRCNTECHFNTPLLEFNEWLKPLPVNFMIDYTHCT